MNFLFAEIKRKMLPINIVLVYPTGQRNTKRTVLREYNSLKNRCLALENIAIHKRNFLSFENNGISHDLVEIAQARRRERKTISRIEIGHFINVFLIITTDHSILLSNNNNRSSKYNSLCNKL